MKEIFEIRWHGRGGQGAKTGALLFGEAAMSTGLYFQAFPEYGPERTGAPVLAFNRLSKEPINVHCGIKNPSLVVVLDPTLIETQNVTEGLKDDGKILINTSMEPNEMRKKLKLKEKQKVYTIDASKIARETIGRDIPNMPMLGAVAKVVGIISLDALLSYSEDMLRKKFTGGKEKYIQGNLEAIKIAYNEVKEG